MALGWERLERIRALGETLDALGFGFVALELSDAATNTLVVRAINERASDLAGVPLEEALSRTIDDALPSVRAAGLADLYAAVVRDGQPRQIAQVRMPIPPMEGEVFRVSAFRVDERLVGVAFDNVRRERYHGIEQMLELLEAIRHLAAGREAASVTPEPALLTEREREIVAHVAEGLTNRGMAQRLGLSVRTVETHRANVMRKLQLRTTAELALYAVRAGLFKPAP